MLLMKARVYRMIGMVFAFVGLATFMILYFRHIEGNILGALSSPSLIVIILVPFLPAAVLSWMAVRMESRFYSLVHKDTSKSSGSDSAKKKK